MQLTITAMILIGLLALPNLFGIGHAFHRYFRTPQERLIWLGVCIFVPVIGGIIYLLFGMRRSSKYEPAPKKQPR